MKNFLFSSLALCGLATLLPAVPITIYNTGSAGNGIDQHYTVTDVNDCTWSTAQAKVINNPNSAWAAPLSGSHWINSSGNGNTSYCADCYYAFTTTFDLTGLNPLTARLSGTVMADDRVAIYLNNTLVNSFMGGFSSGTNFTIGSQYSSAFTSGINYLSFVVDNSRGASGLDAVLSGTAASAVPEPGALGLITGAGLLLISVGTFKKRAANKPNLDQGELGK